MDPCTRRPLPPTNRFAAPGEDGGSDGLDDLEVPELSDGLSLVLVQRRLDAAQSGVAVTVKDRDLIPSLESDDENNVRGAGPAPIHEYAGL